MIVSTLDVSLSKLPLGCPAVQRLDYFEEIIFDPKTLPKILLKKLETFRTNHLYSKWFENKDIVEQNILKFITFYKEN